MSSDSSHAHPLEYLGSQQHKRREHAEAQRRYYERTALRFENLHKHPGTLKYMSCRMGTHGQAQAYNNANPSRLRAKITTPAQIEEAAEKRRLIDAHFRELHGLSILPHTSKHRRLEIVEGSTPIALGQHRYKQDTNQRRKWFVVDDVRLLTYENNAKSYTLDYHIFTTHFKALAHWTVVCNHHHVHGHQDVVLDSEPSGDKENVGTAARPTPSLSPSHTPASRTSSVKPKCETPLVKREGSVVKRESVKPERFSAKRQLKREVTLLSPKCLLYADDSDGEQAANEGQAAELPAYLYTYEDGEHAARRKHSVPPMSHGGYAKCARPLPSSPTRSVAASPCPTPVPVPVNISPTMSLASSLSTASSPGGHRFRDLTTSVPALCRGARPAHTRGLTRSPPGSSSKPSHPTQPARATTAAPHTRSPAASTACGGTPPCAATIAPHGERMHHSPHGIDRHKVLNDKSASCAPLFDESALCAPRTCHACTASASASSSASKAAESASERVLFNKSTQDTLQERGEGAAGDETYGVGVAGGVG
ncbi:hypothetical protein C8R43DRAFT_961098 [Mycena crocata]|nr:hypothetical protein C8R43DRAFT_961098 [Mycena crocata]